MKKSVAAIATDFFAKNLSKTVTSSQKMSLLEIDIRKKILYNYHNQNHSETLGVVYENHKNRTTSDHNE